MCGLTQAEQARELDRMGVDYLGFIFWSPSSRSCPLENLPETSAKKVGVFVNATLEEITAKAHQIDVVQLHGNEAVNLAETLKAQTGLEVWKAVGIGEQQDVEKVKKWVGKVDRILLDSKGEMPGGNGVQFDWNWLQDLGNLQPILAGGIGVDHASTLRQKQGLHAVDINSKFETEPGVKDLERVKKFIQDLRNNNGK